MDDFKNYLSPLKVPRTKREKLQSVTMREGRHERRGRGYLIHNDILSGGEEGIGYDVNNFQCSKLVFKKEV